MKEFKKVDTDGTISYYNEEGQLHQDGDKPAIIWSDDSKEYYVNGKRHRDGDKPAIIRLHSDSKVYSDGELITEHDILYKITSCDLEYWVNGQLHREGDKPAVIKADGTEKYYVNGQLHREGDEPAINNSYGNKWYYRNGVQYFPFESKKQKPKSVWEKMKMLFNIR